jgi:Leucine-rich repeat (LRR) protein
MILTDLIPRNQGRRVLCCASLVVQWQALPRRSLKNGVVFAEVRMSFNSLTALTELYLYANRLTALPDSIGNLTALIALHLGSNRLTAVPDSIGNLSTLAALFLSDNQLTTVPDSIGNLTALTELHLSDNQLAALPHSLANLTALTGLYLYGNHHLTDAYLQQTYRRFPALLSADDD